MLKKIVIIEGDNKIQCDSEEEVVKILIDSNYYNLTEKEKKEKREIKAMANCMNNKMKIVDQIDINNESVDDKFITIAFHQRFGVKKFLKNYKGIRKVK